MKGRELRAVEEPQELVEQKEREEGGQVRGDVEERHSKGLFLNLEDSEQRECSLLPGQGHRVTATAAPWGCP